MSIVLFYTIFLLTFLMFASWLFRMFPIFPRFNYHIFPKFFSWKIGIHVFYGSVKSEYARFILPPFMAIYVTHDRPVKRENFLNYFSGFVLILQPHSFHLIRFYHFYEIRRLIPSFLVACHKSSFKICLLVR